MLIPALGKKRALLVIGAGAVTALAIVINRLPPREEGRGNGVVPLAEEKIATMDAYKVSSAAAFQGFAPGDSASAEAALGKLMEARVPREGMDIHEGLVLSLSAYRDALRSGDAAAAASSLGRLSSAAKSASWLKVSF